jgi:hypothetical protein
MKPRRFGRPSPATAISLVALFFAISGFGIAAKNAITGKDIKDGTVSSKDLAKGAVKAKNLAKGAVGPESIAPDAVTGDAIAPDAVAFESLSDGATGGLVADWERELGESMPVAAQICPNGIIVYNSPCPVHPNRYAEAQNVTSDFTFDLGGGNNCYIRTKVPFSSIKEGVHGGVTFPPGTDIETRQGVFTVTVNGTWEAGTGFARVLQLRKTIGSGPNAGNNQFVGQLIDAPATTGQTSQSLTAHVALDFGDKLSLQVGSCGPDAGADVELDSVSLNLVQGIGQGDSG